MNVRAKIFKNGASQAIRIPKKYRVTAEEVYITKVGDSLIVTPKKADQIEIMFKAIEEFEGKININRDKEFDKRDKLFK